MVIQSPGYAIEIIKALQAELSDAKCRAKSYASQYGTPEWSQVQSEVRTWETVVKIAREAGGFICAESNEPPDVRIVNELERHRKLDTNMKYDHVWRDAITTARLGGLA